MFDAWWRCCPAPEDQMTSTHTPVAGRVATIAAVGSVVAVVHLVAQAAHWEGAARVTQWFLMPLLAVAVALVIRAPRPRLVRLLLESLGFSWLGDTTPGLADGDTSFLLMIAFFFLAQVVFVRAFWPFRDRSVLTGTARHRLLVLAYVAAFVALVVACAPGAGPLLVPVIVYGATLTAMAILATGLNTLVTIGGTVFMVSDSLIALGAFVDGYDVPGHDVWVMVTYIAAQVLIAAGICRLAQTEQDRAAHPLGTTSPN
jgi:uncharacterized membrane protein YhhN